MNAAAHPPGWAEMVLRLALKTGDVDSVSGDLLEAYRSSITPDRGRRRADLWYVTQVFGFVARNARWWGILFGAVWVGRLALDWFAPTSDFHTRSNVSTYVAISLLVVTGFWAAWRSGSVLAGTVAAVAAAAIAAVFCIVAAASLLSIWHGPETMAAIRGSGGVSEVFTLPPVMVLPGLVLGTIGGLVGATGKRLYSA